MEPLKVIQNDHRTILEGTFIELDKNQNRRIYSLFSVIDQIKEIQQNVTEGNFLGEFGHPDRYLVSLGVVSHKITGVWVDPARKELLGRVEVLDTPKGRIVKQLIDSKIPLSIGMRAEEKLNKDSKIEIDKIYSFDLIKHDMADQYVTYTESLENLMLKEKYPPPPKKSTIPPLPKSDTKRELLVFAVYYNVGTQSEARARSRAEELKAVLGKTFEDVEKYTNYLIKFLVFPTKEGDTKMECIFPKNQDNIDLSSIVKISEEEVKGFTVDEEYPKQYGAGNDPKKDYYKSGIDWAEYIAKSINTLSKDA